MDVRTLEKIDASTEVHEQDLDKEEQEETSVNDGKAAQKSDALCNCPQKCWKRVADDVRVTLRKRFKELDDNSKQNEFLQSYIEMRSVFRRLWAQEERIGGRLQRRVSCKYKIPIHGDETKFSEIGPATKLINSKRKQKQAVNVKEGVATIEVCQKAFMNIYGITEKRIRLQREKLIAKLRRKAAESENTAVLQMLGNRVEKQKAEEPQWTSEQALLQAFFCNQLWRPEYIGMAEAKIHQETEPTLT
ncbi:Hypothetical protein NTJ_15756 [Nesidiocoris tenuis]|uniref:Uncharacterized protein n=1 Tax=Nesidiocoris tenuis TaxID=355587 RepID=A0ABN7BI81_9HEMI|nr:Hypothetical protein NTJ_15756 [Nesidiocoris tenuis]